MPTGGAFSFVKIDDIDLDTTNPRIQHYLEHQEPPYTEEMIKLALMTGGDDTDRSGTTFNKLKQSVQTNGGIVQPVILEKNGNRYRCIEGNTRVFLYREFREKNVEGNWSAIPAIVHQDITEEDAHAIRLQAHLVGPRQWDPYSKAKYLRNLRVHEHFTFNQLVDLCGGNQRSITDTLDAYEDIEKYYRPLVGDAAFEQRRFSGFVELQKPGIKKAIMEAGFTVTDFAKWIHEGKIKQLQYVRSLPVVLKDEKAKKTFLESGMEQALKTLDRPHLNKALEEADIASLCRALRQSIESMAFTDFMRMKEDPTSPTVQYLQEIQDTLGGLLDQLELSVE
jgi:hypothetical protein